jgi:hypothetical protein
MLHMYPKIIRLYNNNRCRSGSQLAPVAKQIPTRSGTDNIWDLWAFSDMKVCINLSVLEIYKYES